MSSLRAENVLCWCISDFAQRYKDCIEGDQWASGEYVLEHPVHGPFSFYVQLIPKPADGDERSRVYIRTSNSTKKSEIKLRSQVWFETAEGRETEITAGTLRMNDDHSSESAISFCRNELAQFLDCTDLRLCCAFPYKVTQLNSQSQSQVIKHWIFGQVTSRYQTIELDTSLDFSLVNIPNIKFRLRVCPQQTRDREHCLIDLHFYDRGYARVPPIQVDLWLENSDGERKYKFAELCTTFKSWNTVRSSQYLSYKDLLEFVQKRPFFVCCSIQPLISVIDGPQSQRALFFKAQADTFDVEEFSDAEIRVEDRNFKVKKTILAAQSPVFSRMFSGHTEENLTGVVEIRDLDAGLVELMLRFVYSGGVDELDEFAYELLVLADRYDVKTLTILCVISIVDNLTLDNIHECLKFWEIFHHLQELRTGALKFVDRNGKEMSLPDRRGLRLLI